MTHEHKHDLEPHGGPQNMTGLPDARDIPEYTDVEESMAPKLQGIGESGTQHVEYVNAGPGWWEGQCPR